MSSSLTPPPAQFKPHSTPPHTVRVWDLPTRLFHVLLALCVTGLLITGLTGGNAMTWHFRLGYAVATLLMFRLVWGLVGGYWSRFRSFIFAPSSLMQYVKGERHLLHTLGHNPLGALSVFAMLAVLITQVLTGLTSDDEISNVGPWAKLASGAWVSAATQWHKGWGFKLVIALVLLHLAAIAYHTFKKKEALVSAMVHGDKVIPIRTDQHPTNLPRSQDAAPQRLLALALFALCAATVWYGVVRLA